MVIIQLSQTRIGIVGNFCAFFSNDSDCGPLYNIEAYRNYIVKGATKGNGRGGI